MRNLGYLIVSLESRDQRLKTVGTLKDYTEEVINHESCRVLIYQDDVFNRHYVKFHEMQSEIEIHKDIQSLHISINEEIVYTLNLKNVFIGLQAEQKFSPHGMQVFDDYFEKTGIL